MFARFQFLHLVATLLATVSLPIALHAATTVRSSSSLFTIGENGSSTRGNITNQSGSDIRFGSTSPNFTIGLGYDILLGRALGGNSDPTLHVALKAPDSLTRNDLAGDWHYYDYQVDEGANFQFSTSAGIATLQSDGGLLLDGSPIGSFSIAPGQTVSAQLPGETLTFATNAAKDVLISTSSQAGKSTLRILVKPESGGATNQMAGFWTVGSFGIDFNEDPPDTYYDGDTLIANANGTVTLPDGSATWSANGSGNITFSDNEGSTTLSVNQSRSFLAYTESPTEQNHEGALVLLAVSSPDIADLAGDWTLLTFAFTEAPDINIVETYHPDGETLHTRERFVNGQYDGSPAREEWDENGNLVLAQHYSIENGLTYQLESGYSGDLLSYLTETHYDGETRTSEESTYYHPDGITISEHILDTLTEDGRTVVQSVFTADGVQTSLNQSLDAKPHGLQKDWNAAGQPLAVDSYDHGIRLHSTTWHYHDNGRVNNQTYSDYTSGQNFRTTTSWRSDGTRRQVYRRLIRPNGQSVIHGLQQRHDEGGHLIEEDNFLFGERHGFHRQWYPGGSPAPMSYEAEYKNGKLHGTLSQWYEDGELYYSQDYVEDLQHGESYQYYPISHDGDWEDLTRGVWEYGEMRRSEKWFWDANGTLRNHQLKTAEATDLHSSFSYDYHLWEDFDEQGRPQSYTEHEKGKQHGDYRRWNDGILVNDHYYQQGLQQGRNLSYYDDGTRRSDYLYDNGLKHGPYKLYNENGNLVEEGTYAYDQLHGVSSFWWEEGVTTTTYQNGLRHGPFSSPRESGSYADDKKTGEWSTFDEGGNLLWTETYLNDILHGVSEFYQDGGLRSRERYTNGLQDGLQEYFGGNGTSSETTYDKGIEVGPQKGYHANGQVSSSSSIDVGLAHGSYRSWDAQGRITTSGSYNHGVRTGTWTSYRYDDEGNRDSDTTDHGNQNPDTVKKGIYGTVTYDGKPISDVSLYFGENGPAESTNTAGKYFISLDNYSGDGELTLFHPGFANKTINISLPADFTYTQQDFTLTPHTTPALDLGAPSMAGTYFIRDVSFPFYYNDIVVPGDEDGSTDIFWFKVDNPNAIRVGSSITVNPALASDVDDNGYAGQIRSRAAPGIFPDTAELPTYHIAENPKWAQRLGNWETHHDGYDDEPGEYKLAAKWPPEPFNFGIRKDDVTTPQWLLWSTVPFIGGEDFGIFDTQVTFDARPTTDGKGTVNLAANSEVAFNFDPGVGLPLTFKANLAGNGDGLIQWGNTLTLKQARLKLEGEYSQEFADVGLADLIPVPDSAFVLLGLDGKVFFNLVKAEVEIGLGFKSNIDIVVLSDRLYIPTSENIVSIPWGVEVKSPYLKSDQFEISMKGKLMLITILEGESSRFSTIGGEIALTARLIYEDLVLFDWEESFPEQVEPNGKAASLKNFSTDLRFAPASFAQSKPTFKFHPQDSIHVSSTEKKSKQPQVAALSLPLVENAYPYASPAIAQNGNTKALAFIQYDPNRPEGQSTRLYYSIDSGNGFNTPKPLHSQARSDFSPELAYLPDGRLIAVWKTSQLDQVASTIEERVTGLEIAWSVYNANSDTWSAPVQLSSNNHLDHKPVIATSENGLAVAWHSNPANVYIASAANPDTLNFASWNGSSFGTPTTIGTPFAPIGQATLAYDGTNAALAWIQDVDGDLETTEDIELYWRQFDGSTWTAAQRVTNDSLQDSTPTIFCLENGDFEVIWLKDNQLVRLADPNSLVYETILPSDENGGAPDYAVTCNANGDIALVWTEYADEQHDLFYSLYDSQSFSWSEAINLTQDENQERVPTFVLDSEGALTVAFMSENLETEQRDLHTLVQEAGIDLSIQNLDISPNENQENQFDISATVANSGNRRASNIAVTFHLGDPDNGGTLLGETIVGLLGGETASTTITTSGLFANADGTLHIRIDPANTIAETDETNNTLLSGLNPTELEASAFIWDRDASTDSSLALAATVTNNGRTAQTDVVAEIKDATQTLYATTIDSLEPGESVDLKTTILASTISSDSDTLLTFEVDPDQTLLEPDRSDNEATLTLSARILADSDGDGMENAWELLHFGTLDRDGSGDLDLDGLSDSFEFLILGDPNDPTTTFPFQIRPVEEAPDTVRITFLSQLGRLYLLETSADTSDWTIHSLHPGNGSPIAIEVSTESASFYRVLVSLER